MSDPTRTPGRIDEETTPVNSSASPSEEKLPDAAGIAGIPQENREPGPVQGLAEAIPDDQVDILPVEVIGSDLVEHSPWRIVFWLLAINVLLWMLYEAVSSIYGVWNQSFWLGLPLAVLTCIFLVVLGRTGRREYKALNAVDKLAERRDRMQIALDTNNLTVLRDTLEPTLDTLRQRYPDLIPEFEAAARSRETAAEYLKQFENIVLTQLDKEADAAIKRSAWSGGVLIAIVPHPAFDAAVALWRATALIRKIGRIYGLEPTGLSSLRLLKHTIATAIIAAGTESAANLMMEQFGADAATQAFSSLAQGSITALRLYRLGNHAQKLCRPITS